MPIRSGGYSGLARGAGAGRAMADGAQAMAGLVAIGVGCRLTAQSARRGDRGASAPRTSARSAGEPGGRAAAVQLADKSGRAGPQRRRRSAGGFDLVFCRARRSPPSHRACSPVRRRRGAGSGCEAVAEAAALAAADRSARLLAPRLAADGATCAIAVDCGAWRAIAMTVHFIGAGPARPISSPCGGATCWRAARSVSTRARWFPRLCWPIVRPARASSTPRR